MNGEVGRYGGVAARRRAGRVSRAPRSGYFDDLYDPPASSRRPVRRADPPYQQPAESEYRPQSYDQQAYAQSAYQQQVYQDQAYDQSAYQDQAYEQSAYQPQAYEQSPDRPYEQPYEQPYEPDSYGQRYQPQAWEQRPREAPSWERRPAAVRPGAAPGRQLVGNRLLIIMLFWFGLVTSVYVWWLNNSAGSIRGTASILVAAGRITGMASGFVLLVVILTMSRVAWLEHWAGAHDLLTWHRWLGGLLVVLVPAHGVLLILGYARTSGSSLVGETWSMLTTLEDMISAFVATGVLVLVGVLAVRAIRRALPYEVWRLVHLAMYVVLLLGYGHQFALGAELIRPGFARWYWISLHLFVLVCLVWGRVLEPFWLNLRHRFRVVEVVAEGPGTVSIYVAGRRLDKLEAQAGQYFRWRFLTRRCWWQSHPFSLSAAPDRQWLRLTVKALGDHSKDLQHLRAGVRVVAEGPFGTFTASHRLQPRALLIAVGIGIAPVRALLDDLPADTVLLYRAREAGDLVFHGELEDLAAQRPLRIHYVLGSRDDPGPRRVGSPGGIAQLVPDVRDRDVYLCGPRPVITSLVKVLRRLRVPRRQIHLDPFEF